MGDSLSYLDNLLPKLISGIFGKMESTPFLGCMLNKQLLKNGLYNSRSVIFLTGSKK